MPKKAMTKGYHDMDLLRFTTAGSVDDGKSTLIGRLLYDSKGIFEDQLASLERASAKLGGGAKEEVNLALLTDGLRAEREQGITIDVAYRYFATPKRKFIIADTPGHIQYTRNMVTGASTANLAIVLVDARNGVVEQTRRHAFIASLLKIPHIIFCINKMDLVEYSEARFTEIRDDLEAFCSKLEVSDVRFIPVSALVGDNVVSVSKHMDWYRGGTLMYNLENVHISGDHNHVDCRFPVQFVIRPQSQDHPDFRGYAGRVAGGIFKKGDEVTLLPSGFTSTITEINTMDEDVEEAFAPMSVVIQIKDNFDLSRGDMMVRSNNMPTVSQDLELMVCWMSENPLQLNGKYAIKHTSQDARCIVKSIKYKVNINTLHRIEDDKRIALNDIGRISVRTTKALFYDRYQRNRITGSVILIDESSNETVGAGMLL